MLLKSEFMELEKRCRNGETWPTSVYCHPLLGCHACLCSVGHWASGRLLGGTWPAVAAATTCSTNTTVMLGYWRGGRCWAWGGVLQPGACAPRHTAQLHDDPDSEQRQDIWDEEWFVYWLESPRGTSVVCSAAGGLVGVWSVLLPEAQLKSVVGAASGDHAAHLGCCLWDQVDVRDPFSDCRPCESPWSMLLLAAISKEACFCNNIDDCRFITENERHKASVLTPPSKDTNNVPPSPKKVQMESY